MFNCDDILHHRREEGEGSTYGRTLSLRYKKGTEPTVSGIVPINYISIV